MRDPRPTVMIADEHAFIADVCKNLLETEFDVLGIATNGRDLVDSALRFRPDVIVLSVSMPILNGFDAGQHLKEWIPSVKLVYLAHHSSEEIAAEAVHRGASGFVAKTCASSELFAAVRRALNGRIYLCSSISTARVRRLVLERKGRVIPETKLTPAQTKVLQLVAEGRRSKEISEILNISARTVEFHKNKIKERLGARTIADLIRFAVDRHMVGAKDLRQFL
jgi:DNA-binding NarL/FixJ family response regulator